MLVSMTFLRYNVYIHTNSNSWEVRHGCNQGFGKLPYICRSRRNCRCGARIQSGGSAGNWGDVACVPEFADVAIDDKVRTAIKLVIEPRK
jgi:hypothetical protein